MIEVPYRDISPDALQGLLEDFVTRQGYDTAETELSLEDLAAQVRQQLITGQLTIVYDGVTESVTVLTKQEYHARLQSAGLNS
ncbi:YheU family protein [Oceanospirillum sediminis]|uniref:YheU family protein n=1 Tax=Oceanospirillum sediminis TaxID=2760088 RepID=A0A839ILX4_9GAMM|nr:YheU family protein [Oceanospirillum sediminis]MBB1485694.1 YheU family protein [Oceanospirillum sediminis]